MVEVEAIDDRDHDVAVKEVLEFRDRDVFVGLDRHEDGMDLRVGRVAVIDGDLALHVGPGVGEFSLVAKVRGNADELMGKYRISGAGRYNTSISSTLNTSALYGGMAPGAPASP